MPTKEPDQSYSSDDDQEYVYYLERGLPIPSLLYAKRYLKDVPFFAFGLSFFGGVFVPNLMAYFNAHKGSILFVILGAALFFTIGFRIYVYCMKLIAKRSSLPPTENED